MNDMIENDELRQAELRACRAAELLTEFNDLLKKMNEEFPTNTFGFTKSQIAKARGIDRTLDRLKIAQNRPLEIQSRIKRQMELEEKQKKECERKKQEIEDEQEALKVRDEAIKLLLDKGLEFGKGFTVETAIDDANELVLEDIKKEN